MEEKYNIKGSFVLSIIGLLMLCLVLRLFQLQILEVGKYRHASSINHILEIPLRPLRGDILDRNGRKLAQNHIQYDLYIASIGDDKADSEHLKSLAALTQMNAEDIENASKILETSSGEAPVLLKTDIPLGMVIELKEKSDDFQFALIDKSSKRSYPLGTLTSHILGYLREIDDQRLKELKGAGYLPGDITGDNGIERQYDTNLRGFAGRKLMEVDNRGHWKGLLKRWEENEDGTWIQKTALYPPTKGKDLGLTIDSSLQKLVAREIGENIGGAIVMDANSGEILAMYCYPVFDANLFVGKVNSIDWADLMNNPDKPLQNRLIQNAYPPGSVFKVILALAGLIEGKITPHTTVQCTGTHKVGSRDFKCWKKYGHGQVDLNRAIAESCDIYFYQLGEKLGAEKIVEYANLLGFGSATGIDLPGENSGLIPTAQWKQERIGERWYKGDTVNMSIGQGFLQVTPIQIVRLYAFFANGGKLINPHLNLVAITRDNTPEKLKNINPEYLKIISDGLRRTVTSGTARGCYLPDVSIAGKTGTADDPPRKIPHSWFVSFAPAENPKVVLVVFGQNGGHSDKLAVPIAKKIYSSSEMRHYITVE
ncbi:penicillin-binding protein 2 [bacterium]|nr:penicillin-binding protein 2 [bacterium]MBU1024849.1 penicillin-binding protein 2 [bacterium]